MTTLDLKIAAHRFASELSAGDFTGLAGSTTPRGLDQLQGWLAEGGPGYGAAEVLPHDEGDCQFLITFGGQLQRSLLTCWVSEGGTWKVDGIRIVVPESAKAVEQRAYGLRRRTSLDFAAATAGIRDALKAQGFGVLTEIDVQATLKAKLGIDQLPYLILGACNPGLAHRALTADPEVGLLLPCNVVVRDTPEGTLVEALDPAAAMGIVKNEAVVSVAEEAKAKLRAALASLPA
jgi:uncharacterized protein (DUF302 family)